MKLLPHPPQNCHPERSGSRTLRAARSLDLYVPSAATILRLATALLALTLSTQAQTPDIPTLRANFLTPPNSSRPMVRWWWFGPAVEKPEILRELKQMKFDGVGGAELAFVYPEQLDGNLPFLSPPMLEAVTYAQAEGRKLGLRIDVTLCSGWPYGGPATTLDQAASKLKVVELALHPSDSSLPQVKLAEGDKILSVAVVKGEPRHWDPNTAQPIGPSGTFAAQAGPRVALIFVQSHTRQQVKRAAVGAEGYVLDPMSHDSVALHLKSVGEPLVKAFGVTPPYAIFSDSLETYGADWTPRLPEEFKKRRGYDLLPRLPQLIAGGSPAAENLRHDYGRTLTELVDENYLTQINDWAKAHGTKFRSQTYGEPAVSFSSQRLVDLIEGEGPQWRAFSTLRWATSAAHVFGHEVASGETFTWLHSPVFRATPLDMKAEADVDFIMGENSLSFHGWPYSPSADKLTPGDPGWSLYAAGVFNDHNPWHPVMPAVNDYIARISYLLRQGKPANQVAILLPTDDAWATFTPGSKVTVTGAMSKLISKDLMSAILSAGYNADFIDADAIDTVGLGTHQIVVVPPTDRIPAQTLRKLDDFKRAGGKVIALGRIPSLTPDGKPLPGTKVAFGTLVADAAALPEALHTAATPDFKLASDEGREHLGFIRRKLPNADIYFVTNTGNTPLHTTVELASNFRSGNTLDADLGTASLRLVSPRNIELDLAPYESRAYLFWVTSSADVGPPAVQEQVPLLVDLSTDWDVSFTSIGQHRKVSLTSWTDDPATLHYSGEVIYSRDVNLARLPATAFLQIEGGQPEPGDPTVQQPTEANRPEGMPNPLVTRTGPGMHAYYEAPLREAALVVINGQDAGALWHPPYRLEITRLLKPGPNRIEIHVYNTALNAWSGIPPRDYGPLKAKYGDRFQMQDLNLVKPIPSGILGQIKLVQEPAQ